MADKFRVDFRGKSMQPTLKEGMQVLVERVEPEGIKLADIILYKQVNSLVCHRVIKIIKEVDKSIFVTKADNHAYVDASFIPENSLLGRVTAAFWPEGPEKNILVKSRVVDLSYLLIGNLVLFLRKYRKFIPKCIRDILKIFVGGFFFVFKKTIHCMYLFIRN